MRGRGEGTVYKRARRRRDGSVYYRWQAATPNTAGVPRSFGPLRKTRGEAVADLSALRAAAKLGVNTSTTTLGAYLDAWLAGKSLKVRARDTYKTDIRLHLKPTIGHVKLCDLTPSHVKAMMTTAQKAGPSAARKARAVLHAALQDAVVEELVVRNVASLVDAPPVPRREPVRWETEHAAAFIEQAASVTLSGPVFLLVIGTGLRIGEALGLLWSDLDRDYLLIRRQLLTVGAARFDLPKTRQGSRDLRLGADLLAVLDAHRQSLGEIGLLRPVSVPWADGRRKPVVGELMFPSPRGVPWRLETLRDRFNEMIDAAKVARIRIHDLRHYHLSKLISGGTDELTVSARGGHSRPSTTRDLYGYAFKRRVERPVGLAEMVDD